MQLTKPKKLEIKQLIWDAASPLARAKALRGSASTALVHRSTDALDHHGQISQLIQRISECPAEESDPPNSELVAGEQHSTSKDADDESLCKTLPSNLVPSSLNSSMDI